MSTAYAPNQRIKVIASSNTLLQESTRDVGRLGTILATDHPAAGIAGSLTVVLDPWHNGLETKQHRVLRFFDPSQVEPA